MENTINSVFYDKKLPFNVQYGYLQLSEEFHLNESKTLDILLKQIKNDLSIYRSRPNALILLSKLIFRLKVDVFMENCSSWSQASLKVLQESKNINQRRLAYKVLAQILVRIHENNCQNLIKEFRTNFMPVFTQIFCELRKSDLPYSITCLSICCTLFNSFIFNKRKLFEDKLLEAVSFVIESNCDYQILKSIGFCFSKVIFSGTVSHVRWKQVFCIVMNTLEILLCSLNLPSIKKNCSFKFQTFETLTAICFKSKDAFVENLKNLKSVYFITSTICSLLSGYYFNVVSIPVGGILQYLLNLSNILVSLQRNKSHKLSSTTIGIVTPALFENIFDILKTLLLVCKTNLIPFTYKTNQIIITTVEWLNLTNSTDSKTCCVIYSFLSDYFNLLGVNSSMKSDYLNSVIEQLSKNFQTQHCDVKVFGSFKMQNNFKNSSVVGKRSDQVTILSIKAINSMLNSFGCLMDNSSYILIQNNVLYSLLYVYRNWFNLKYPFNDENCRAELIETLKLLIQNSPNNFTPPLETAIVIVKEAHRLDTSRLVHYASFNCLHIFNFILSSRIMVVRDNSRLSVNLLPKNQSIDSSDCIELPEIDSVSNKEPKVITTTIIESSTMNVEPFVSKESDNGKLFPTSKKEDAVSSKKVSNSTDPNEDDDIIFEGVFNSSTEKASTTIDLSEDTMDKSSDYIVIDEIKKRSDSKLQNQANTVSQPMEICLDDVEESGQAQEILSFFVDN